MCNHNEKNCNGSLLPYCTTLNVANSKSHAGGGKTAKAQCSTLEISGDFTFHFAASMFNFYAVCVDL